MAKFVPVKLSYKTFEPASGSDAKLTPVIFMHALTMSKEAWEDIPQIIADKTKRKAYAYDARNHGDSEHSDHFSFDLNVDDLFHFMDTMNIQKAILIGHSMGSFTATNAALRKPERVEMIFSEDMYVKKLPKESCEITANHVEECAKIVPTIPKELNQTEASRFLLDSMISKVPEEMVEELFGDKESLYKMKFVFRRKPDGGYAIKFNKDAIVRLLKNPDLVMSEPSGQFKGPAVFIYGPLSQFKVGTEADHIRKHFPNAELIEFAGATHNVHTEFPDKFVKTVLEYLQKAH